MALERYGAISDSELRRIENQEMGRINDIDGDLDGTREGAGGEVGLE